MGGAEVRCSVCDRANEIGARFCSQCGTQLPQICPVCSATADPDARFCSSCGTRLATDDDAALREHPVPDADVDLYRYVPASLLSKIRAARSGAAMRGERRTVTMLFADIQGSTAAAERLDPEEWAEIVNGAFEHLIAPVYRYEGTLARLQGDAILAFFGAPIAHEDDPIRAVHAGLEIIHAVDAYGQELRRRTDVPIAVRVGINTGLVVVGEVGSDLRVEYTALGDAVNVAARMEQTAEPGTVRITSGTAELLGATFATTVIGPVDVKGKREPVEAVRVDGVAERAPAGATTPLIAREREQQQLVAMVERLTAGVGGVATIVAEAGIGKSRLLAAVREHIATAFTIATTSQGDGELSWLEGQSRSFDSDVPYAPFLDVATRWLDLGQPGGHEVFDRVAAAVARAFGKPDLDTSSYLTHVTGAPLPMAQASLVGAMDTPTLHEKTTTAIMAYLEAEAARRPLVIVLEDLHWADAMSLALAEQLVHAAERVPIVLIAALRPVREDPAWRLVEVASREAAHRHTAIQLDALDDAAADQLLDALLGGRTLSPDDRRRVLDRADGNPLFVEEIAGSIGDGVAGDIPASLASLLSARLDRLDEEDRRLAEVAAVVGNEFEPDAVVALVDDVEIVARLPALVRAGVLVERQRLPSPRYAFRHVLVQEAAYGTILLRDRRALHGRLARHLEAVRSDLPQEIARHHLASDTPTAAFPWLVEAAVRATRVMALSDAIRLLTSALDHLPDSADPELVGTAHETLGEAYGLVPDLDHASAAYQSLAELGRTSDRPSLEVRALNRLALNVATLGGDMEAADGYLQAARRRAEEAGDEVGLAEYHMNACFLAGSQGQFERSVFHDEQTMRLGTVLGADEIRLGGQMRRVLSMVAGMQFADVDAALTEAKQAATAAGADDVLAMLAFDGEALLRYREGDLATARALVHEAIPVLDRYGSSYLPLAHHASGRFALQLGDVEEAVTRLAQAVRIAEGRGHRHQIGAPAAALAHAYAICRDEAASRDHRALAVDSLAAPLGGYVASSIWADLGFASIELGHWEQAEADFAIGLEASSATRFWERANLLTGAARVAHERGDVSRTRDLLDEAAAYAAERGLALPLPLIASVAALIARGRGELSAAEDHLVDAARTAEAMGLRLLACDIASLRAELAAETGRHQEAATQRDRHAQLTEELRNGVVDPSLREGLTARLKTSAPWEPTG